MTICEGSQTAPPCEGAGPAFLDFHMVAHLPALREAQFHDFDQNRERSSI